MCPFFFMWSSRVVLSLNVFLQHGHVKESNKPRSLFKNSLAKTILSGWPMLNLWHCARCKMTSDRLTLSQRYRQKKHLKLMSYEFRSDSCWASTYSRRLIWRVCRSCLSSGGNRVEIWWKTRISNVFQHVFQTRISAKVCKREIAKFNCHF